MPKFTFIRHFTTPWNQELRLQGARDIALTDPLSPQDAATLEINKKTLGTYNFDLVIASPLTRVQQTAALHGYHISQTIDDMIELNFGDLEGKTKPYRDETFPNLWETRPFDLPLGETQDAFVARVSKVRDELTTMDVDHVLGFGHGAWIRCFKCIHESIDPINMNTFDVSNGALMHFTL